MQLGTENRNKTIAAGALMAVGILGIVYSLYPSSAAPVAASATPPATTIAAAASPSRPRPGEKKGSSTQRSLDPTLRNDWLKISESNEYSGTGRNIFLATAEEPIPTPNAPGHTDTVVNTGPPVPPPPPPINLKFFGFASKPGEPKKIFLSQGEDVFIASEGDIIDRRYKILRIAPMSVEVEDVLNNNRQSIPLTQG